MAPLAPADFTGRVVLDAGCGMGRLTAVAAEWGVAEVVGLDLSEAVDASRAYLGGDHRIHLVQGDILQPPFRRRSGKGIFDLIYSIGVLHHLPDPAAGFQALVELLAGDGRMAVWVYGREGNEWIVRWVTPARLAVFSRLPRWSLYAIAWQLAFGLFPLTRLAAAEGSETTGPPVPGLAGAAWHPILPARDLRPVGSAGGTLPHAARGRGLVPKSRSRGRGDHPAARHGLAGDRRASECRPLRAGIKRVVLSRSG